MKKSTFKVMAEALAFDKLKDVKLPLDTLRRRKATIDEIKAYIVEEYTKAKSEEAKKKEMGILPEEEEGGWGDAEIMNYIKWLKALDIKEFFKRGK